jgi:hypothetical protein
MPPARPNTAEMNEERTMVSPIRASEAAVIADAMLAKTGLRFHDADMRPGGLFSLE